jgi:uncharacterized membrane protein
MSTVGTEIVPVPPTREFAAAWIAYGLFALGVFLWWPAIGGLIVCYAKRGHPQAGFIDAHYRWLIRTFWWSLLWYLACLAVIVAAAWPIASDVIRQALAGTQRIDIDIDWTSLVASAGVGVAGGFGLLAVWLWFVYRVVRGMFSLYEARAPRG